MAYNAKTRTIAFDGKELACITFGRGAQPLVMICGLGEGLRQLDAVRGSALGFAWMYRSFVKDFTVYAPGRPRTMEPGYSTRDMAADLARAMDELDVAKAHVVGISEGGMIAQWLAIDAPERVEKLVLGVTSARPNPVLLDSLDTWTDLAQRNAYPELMRDTYERMYTPAYLAKTRAVMPVATRIGRPETFDRFLIQAEACRTHNAFADLPRIGAPTLVLGGTDDRCLGGEASIELAKRIPGAQVHLFGGQSHGAYEECPEFMAMALEFLRG